MTVWIKGAIIATKRLWRLRGKVKVEGGVPILRLALASISVQKECGVTASAGFVFQ